VRERKEGVWEEVREQGDTRKVVKREERNIQKR
jgi:hypothetical protein